MNIYYFALQRGRERTFKGKKKARQIQIVVALSDGDMDG
jgi:hypothetical protein